MARARPASRGGEAGDDEAALTPVTPVSTKVARPMPVCSSRPLGAGESDAGEPGCSGARVVGAGCPGRQTPAPVHDPTAPGGLQRGVNASDTINVGSMHRIQYIGYCPTRLAGIALPGLFRLTARSGKKGARPELDFAGAAGARRCVRPPERTTP